jgi:hypothetical protein
VPLSTWGEAIVAAATGNAQVMRLLLQDLDSGKDDADGIDLRSFRTSHADVTFIARARQIRIDPNYTLIEIAVERDHFECVMALTEAPTKPAEAATEPPRVMRSVSHYVPATLADELRDLQASCIETIPAGNALAGLCLLRLPPAGRQTFTIPREMSALALEARRTALGMLLEDPYTQEGVDAAMGWWSAALAELLRVPPDAHEQRELSSYSPQALYTSGDGNCLLHAACLATIGVRDTREALEGEPGACTARELESIAPRRTLRAALHASLLGCLELRRLLAAHGVELEGSASGTEPAAANTSTLESRSRLHGNSCDPGHLLVLAHILARPIVCFASAAVGEVRVPDDGRSLSSYAAKGERMSGIYLPCLLPPQSCSSRAPVMLVYTQGHFSALVSPEAAANAAIWRALGFEVPAGMVDLDSVPVPLVDETRTALPVLFPPPPEGGAMHTAEYERSLLAKYLDVYEASIGDGAPVPITSQTVPRRATPESDHMTDRFYETFAVRRISSAAMPEDPDSSKPPRASRVSSRQDSAHQRDIDAAIAASLQEQAGEGPSGRGPAAW